MSVSPRCAAGNNHLRDLMMVTEGLRCRPLCYSSRAGYR
jgi:hypothetical protein